MKTIEISDETNTKLLSIQIKEGFSTNEQAINYLINPNEELLKKNDNNKELISLQKKLNLKSLSDTIEYVISCFHRHYPDMLTKKQKRGLVTSNLDQVSDFDQLTKSGYFQN